MGRRGHQGHLGQAVDVRHSLSFRHTRACNGHPAILQRFPRGRTRQTHQAPGEPATHGRPRIRHRDPVPARRATARHRHRIARAADLPDHLVRVRRRRPRGEPVQPPDLREHLHPIDEPDHRDVRGANGGARGWPGGGGHGIRNVGPDDRVPDPACRRGSRRLVEQALRRELLPARRELPQARHRDHVRGSGRPRELRPRHPRQHPGPLRRDHRQPPHQRARHRAGGGDCPRRRVAADDRQHLPDAVPVPPVRVGGGPRHALRHEVHRRARDVDRRSGRRVGQVPLGQRQVSGNDGALAGLPRRAVLRNVRRFRVHDARPLRDPAHLRTVAEPVQLVPLPARPRDTARAHGPALQQHARGRALPRRPSSGGLGELSGPRVEPLSRVGPQVSPEGRKLHPHLRHPGRPGRGRGVHRGVAVHEPPRERRRREDPGHSPGLDDPPPVVRR